MTNGRYNRRNSSSGDKAAGSNGGGSSNTLLTVNPDWAKLPLFDRLKWTQGQFGEVVENRNETVAPAEAGIERFIGLEHLEPGSLHVRKWGNVAAGTTFTRRCRPGQVLFGKRRAYQRKVAVAEFDAVVSGDIYVLAPKNERLLSEFLPFLCLSERFFQHAVGTSAGSLSPRTNWSSLCGFEFDLPPLDQQRRIAEILWAVDEDEQQKAEFAKNVRGLLTAELEEELDQLFDQRCERLEKVLLGSPESGSSAPPSPTETGHYVLSLAALSRTGYVRGNLKPIPPTKAMMDCRLSLGDFLISRSNTQELVGLVGIFDEDRDDVSFPDTMMRLRVDEGLISKRFLEAVLHSRRGRLHMMRSAAGTSGSMKKINRRTLGICLIPTPALKVQERLLSKLECLHKVADSANAARYSANAMKLALLESFLGGQP
jgi:type I restriction enzyme, S subunit